ncbi:hypothetical protein C2S52_011242 [Perilla frutescens var. hirtella]|nr:hypothetical protein C2S52_011242 [Perilla frutescens var. hirtella]KAH6786070.1 hypothetical protein C2S51_038525 [Perilla frutescens var. frutescens]
MSSRGSRADKGKGKAIADSSEAPRRRRQYVNPYGGADSGFYNDPSGGDFYNNPTTQMEVDEEVARWIKFEELQQSQESRAFSENPSIDLDTEEAEEEVEVPAPTRNTALKSALFTIHFRKVAMKNEQGVFDLYCNYCPKQYKFRTEGGYGTY